MPLRERLNASARVIKLVSILLIVVAIFLFMQALPVDRGIEAVRSWVDGLGIWGPVVYAGIYVVATVLMLPGSVLTLTAGAVFGVGWGTATVSIGSTTGAALSFLVARHVARKRVAGMAAEHPSFEAIDRAVGQEGWKIVALLRLSPFVPFNLQNYFYGITSIRFWPCVLASWIAMLPGTLMYVAIGAGVLKLFEETSWVELVFWGVGIGATIAVSVYITVLAVRAVRARTDIPSDPPPPRATPASPRAALTMAAVAVLVLGSAVFGRDRIGQLVGSLLGPPQVAMVEAYEPVGSGPTVDHSAFEALLKQHVDDGGLVDYAGLERDRKKLQEYIAHLGRAKFDELDRDEKLALLINAYNAFTLELILKHWNGGRLKSIRDIDKPWDTPEWNLMGRTLSLNDLEHKEIRPKFREPRIHFVLVCAAIGCPKLRNEVYTAKDLEKQLEEQTQWCHERDRWFEYDAAANTVHLTQLYSWYGGDFEQADGSVERFAARYSPALKAALDAGRKPRVRWLEYDWALNKKS